MSVSQTIYIIHELSCHELYVHARNSKGARLCSTQQRLGHIDCVCHIMSISRTVQIRHELACNGVRQCSSQQGLIHIHIVCVMMSVSRTVYTRLSCKGARHAEAGEEEVRLGLPPKKLLGCGVSSPIPSFCLICTTNSKL